MRRIVSVRHGKGDKARLVRYDAATAAALDRYKRVREAVEVDGRHAGDGWRGSDLLHVPRCQLSPSGAAASPAVTADGATSGIPRNPGEFIRCTIGLFSKCLARRAFLLGRFGFEVRDDKGQRRADLRLSTT